jgi:glycerol-3-phosphate dehydrogenase (NAD(P)+)
MKISIIGGGAWGTTLAQSLADNNHDVMIMDVNSDFVEKINTEKTHPFFNSKLPENIIATTKTDDAINFSDIIVLCVPTKVMRTVLKTINEISKTPKLFINVSKGIEPKTSLTISKIVEEEIETSKLMGYVCLSGPSHAEELILRNLTSLVAASKNLEHAKFVQEIFSNDKYLRVYTTDDVIGVETGGSMKNAIAIISGICSGLGLGENARAFLITRGMKELVSIVLALGGKMETVYGLSGIGDLIVTASSLHSRNFQCGLKIGKGMSVSEAQGSIVQSVEGIRAIIAGNDIVNKYNIELPLIQTAYKVVTGELEASEALKSLLTRSLKEERYW